MTTNPADGGPAFPMASGPEPRVNATTHYNEGMSLRDYFAARAMGNLIGRGEHYRIDRSKCRDAKCFARSLLPLPTVADYPRLARMSYAIADLMLAARKETP